MVHAVHPSSMKIYRNLKEYYWWQEMKKDIADYISKCITCHQIKAEHKHRAGLLQSC